jgi:hypothetical protein
MRIFKQLFLITFILPVMLWAQTPVQIDFGGPITGKVGDEVTLDVAVSDLTGLGVYGFKYELLFNPEVVDIQSSGIVRGQITPNANFIHTIRDGSRLIVSQGATVLYSGSGILFSIKMTLKKDGFYTDALKVNVFSMGDVDTEVPIDKAIPYNILLLTGDAPTINVQGGSAAVGYDDPIFVPISVVNRADLTVGNYSLNVSYNPNDVKYEGFSFAGTLTNPAQTTVSHNEQDNRITITGTGLSNNFVSDSLVVLQFSGTDFKFFENSLVQVSVTSIATQSEINLNPIPSNGSISVRGSLTAPGKQIQFLEVLNDSTIYADSVFSFQYRAFDPYNMGLKFTSTNLPIGATLGLETGILNWTPDRAQAGLNSIEVVAANELISTSTISAITVLAVNRAPVFSKVLGDTTIVQGDVLEFQFSAIDLDDDVLTYSIVVGPASAEINSETGLFRWNTADNIPGSFYLEIEVKDGELTDTTSSVIILLPSNYPPEFVTVLPDTIISENQTLSFTYTAEDIDEDVLVYTLTNGPADATINSETGELTWFADFGTHNQSPYVFTVVASDGEFSDTTSATVTVLFANRPPTFTRAFSDTTIVQAESLVFLYEAEDPDDNQTLVFSLNNEPTGAEINAQTGEFSWTPGYDISGTILLEVIVSDGIDSVMHISTIIVEEAELNNVTFVVYMDLVNDYDPQTEVLYVAGDLSIVSNWETPGSNSTLILTKSDDVQYYSLSIRIPDASIAYKFFTNDAGQSGWNNGEWDGDPNRLAVVNSDTTFKHIFGVRPGELLSIRDTRRVSVGAPVDFAGQITTPAFTQSDGTSVYVQDDNAGLRLILPPAEDYSLIPGNTIMVSGEVGDGSTDFVVEATTLTVSSTTTNLPEPVVIDDLALWSINSGFQSMRVTLQDLILTENSDWPVESPTSGFGTIAQSTGITGSMFANEFLSIFVVKGASEFDGSPKPAGAFNLTGVLSLNDNGPQILPFYSSELTTATSNFDAIDLELPERLELYQNYPNPFNPITTLKYEIAEQSYVRLEVFNIMGQHMVTLTDSELTPGSYQVQFDGSNMASGTYLVRLQAGNHIRMMKMTLLK